ncbi:hypothetical protein DH2020_033155 [Rehmannia glutinosa]|uniref:CCHC-type domain-containing protein n=1 Tax=Rehmannia glutinosa TaxID=99300 RepID=A0ABR0VDE1_REHGL
MDQDVVERLKNFSLTSEEKEEVALEERDILKSKAECVRSLEDKKRVLTGKTWTFDNQFLLLREWSEKLADNEEAFNSVEIWVQIWNLPFHWVSMETGRKIGNKFPRILDVDIPDAGTTKGRYIRILAEINLQKPLLRGTNIKLNSETHWLDFKYENMQNFCFYCGLIGHLEKGCNTRRDDLRNNDIKDGQFGDWLRAHEVTPSRQFNRSPKTPGGT